MGSGGKSTQDAWFQRALALAGASVLIILAAMLISTAMNAWPVFTHSGWSLSPARTGTRASLARK